MGRWRKHIYEGVGADARHRSENALERPARKSIEICCFTAAGDRHITYEWKQRGGGVWKHGGKWEGIIPQLLSSFKKTAAGPRRLQLEKYMRVVRCPTCQGQRLNPQARAVRVGGKTLVEVCAMPIGDLAQWLDPEHGTPASERASTPAATAPSPAKCSRKSAAGSASCSTSACIT